MNEQSNNGIVNNQMPNNSNMNYNIPNPNTVPSVGVEPMPQMNNAVPSGVTPTDNINQQSIAQPVGVEPTPQVNNAIPNGVNQQSVVEPISPVNNSTPQASVSDNNAPAAEPVKKKKGLHPVVVMAILFVLIAGAAAGYYFFLETPQKIYGAAFDKVTKVTNGGTIFDGYVNYSLKLNVNTENKQYKAYTDVINNLNISGTSGYNVNSKIFNTNNIILYKNKQLLDLNMMADINSNTSYLKLNNVFDKVLMVKNEDTNNGEDKISSVDTNISDYLAVKDAITANMKKALETADYKKELVALNGARVTKTTLYINAKLINTYYDYLISDNAFITNYAKITQMTAEEVRTNLTKTKDEFKESNKYIALYTSLVKNDLLKLEVVDDGDSLTVDVSDNGYKYEYKEANKIQYNGTFSTSKDVDKQYLTVSFNVPEEEITFNINLSYSSVSKIDNLDITNAVNIDDLSTEETNAITMKFMESDAFKVLLKDIGFDQDSSSMTGSAI